ncbi:sister-chromatid cohesion protein 3 [Tanacetum coccineum]
MLKVIKRKGKQILQEVKFWVEQYEKDSKPVVVELSTMLFEVTCASCYRDIDPDIRMSGQSLGAWIVSYTSLFLQDLYMKYLGRTLNGKSVGVKKAYILALQDVYDVDDNVGVKMVESDGVGGWLGFKVFVVDGYVDGGGDSWWVLTVVAGYWWMRTLEVSCLLMLTWKIFVSLNNPLPLMSGFRSGGFSRVVLGSGKTPSQRKMGSSN